MVEDVGQERIKAARELLEKFSRMSIAEVGELVARECGEELALFMLEFVSVSVQRSATVDNIWSLMLMGYMIRANEEKHRQFQGPATA